MQKEAASLKKAQAGAATAGATTLIQGSEFISHRVSSSGALESKTVFLFLDPELEKLGTIFWCDQGKREKIAGQSIPLQRVSDVFLGSVDKKDT